MTHKNTKSKLITPYQKTKKSTKTHLISYLKKNTPKKTFQKTNKKLKNTITTTNTKQTPQNQKQTYKIKQSKPTTINSKSLN